MRELLEIHGFEIIHKDGYTYAGKIYEGSSGTTKLSTRRFIDKLLPNGLREGMLILGKKP